MQFSSGDTQEQRKALVTKAFEWLAQHGGGNPIPEAAVANATGFIQAAEALGVSPSALACILEMSITGKPMLFHSYELEEGEGGDALTDAAELNRLFKTSNSLKIINMLMAQFVANERVASDRQ